MPMSDRNQLIEFEVQRPRIAILGVLKQERDEKRDLRRNCVHRQLPRIGKPEDRTQE